MPNEVTSTDGGCRILFAFVAQWPAAAEFLRSSRQQICIRQSAIASPPPVRRHFDKAHARPQ